MKNCKNVKENKQNNIGSHCTDIMVMAVCIVVPSLRMTIFITHVEHWNSLKIWKMKNI